MPDLAQQVLAFIRRERLIEPHQSVLAGISGGIDSTALLFVLHSLSAVIPFSISVCHVNHMLRGRESERDEEFVRDLAGRLSLPCHVKRFNVKDLAKSGGKSVQHAGRDARYDYFRELVESQGYDRIAIAHNRDDQVETFVLRVVKGTGVRGLSCIPVKRERIIRPFLDTTRKEIERYILERQIQYVEDSSNQKDGYERNYVRHRILPSMEKLNPATHSRIMSLLDDLTRLNRRLDREAYAFLQEHTFRERHGTSLPLVPLKECDEEARFRVLSLVLGDLVPGFIALRGHVRLIEKILASSRPSSMAVLPSGITVRREYDKIICTAAGTPQQVLERFALHPGHNTVEPLGISLDIVETSQVPAHFPADRFTACLDSTGISDLGLRTFRNGDRFIPLGMGNTVKLKDYFISRKIPRGERRTIPLLVTRDNIVWVIGERMDDRFKVTDRTTKVLCVTARKLATTSE